MNDKDERFRRIAAPTTGDLFVHYGVAGADAPEVGDQGPIAQASDIHPAQTCGRCGWFITQPADACPLCGAVRGQTAAHPGDHPA